MYPTTFGKFLEPKVVVTHFHLREGDKVADFGAGSGHYMAPLSSAVGKSGAVYLCEIQKNLVDTLGIHAREKHLTNVYPLWCDLESRGGIKLGDGHLDAGLISNTLFQFEDKKAGLAEIVRTLRTGGKLFIIDWTDSFGGLGPKPGDVLTEEEARRLGEEAHLVFEHDFPAGDHHYGLAFRKQ